MKRVWTPEMITLLRKVYPKYEGKELQRFFPAQTVAAIKSKAKKLGIIKEKQRFYFTPEQIEILKRDYANTDNIVFIKKFGCSSCSVYNIAYRLGLKKSKEYICKNMGTNLKTAGVAYRYPKGHIPANKGKKMLDKIYEKCKGTMFEKGHIPENYRPVGSERTNKYGYIEIKVADKNRWQQKHRHVWEQHNGTIPKGSNIQFKDGNRQNCDISNLYIISRSEQIHNNSIMRYPNEVKTAIRRVNKIIQLTKNQ